MQGGEVYRGQSVQHSKRVFSDSNNLFLWHEWVETNKKSLFRKSQFQYCIYKLHSKITMTCNMVPYYRVTALVPSGISRGVKGVPAAPHPMGQRQKLSNQPVFGKFLSISSFSTPVAWNSAYAVLLLWSSSTVTLEYPCRYFNRVAVYVLHGNSRDTSKEQYYYYCVGTSAVIIVPIEHSVEFILVEETKCKKLLSFCKEMISA